MLAQGVVEKRKTFFAVRSCPAPQQGGNRHESPLDQGRILDGQHAAPAQEVGKRRHGQRFLRQAEQGSDSFLRECAQRPANIMPASSLFARLSQPL